MIALPLTDACAGCGRCCQHIGLPPFEAANPEFGPQRVSIRGLSDTQITDAVFDTELFLLMPAELRRAHAEMLLGLIADPTGGPCAWFDQDMGRCRNYEWRPATCRRFWANDARCQELCSDPAIHLHWQDDTTVPAWLNPRR